MRTLLNFVGICSVAAMMWGVISTIPSSRKSAVPSTQATITTLSAVQEKSWGDADVTVTSEKL